MAARASCAAECRETWQMVTRACPQCGGACKPESENHELSHRCVSSAAFVKLLIIKQLAKRVYSRNFFGLVD